MKKNLFMALICLTVATAFGSYDARTSETTANMPSSSSELKMQDDMNVSKRQQGKLRKGDKYNSTSYGRSGSEYGSGYYETQPYTPRYPSSQYYR